MPSTSGGDKDNKEFYLQVRTNLPNVVSTCQAPRKRRQASRPLPRCIGCSPLGMDVRRSFCARIESFCLGICAFRHSVEKTGRARILNSVFNAIVAPLAVRRGYKDTQRGAPGGV